MSAITATVLGLDVLQEHRPDCVLLDVRIPEMDGWRRLCVSVPDGA